MAPITQASDESNHQALLDQLDLFKVRKPFRNPNWKPPQRRNKNVKQIISEATRKEASVMATQNNSGISTPLPPASTPGADDSINGAAPANIAQAAQNLSTMVLEKSLASHHSNNNNNISGSSGNNGPAATYTNIESAPSLHPSSQRHYCDITGLSAPYTDPKTRLRYHDKEIFALIRTLPQNTTEDFLAARGAHTVLK
ncbi:MAG: hypothetical protein Q9165_005831 [Trypethelium subeluteriae]